MGPTDAQLSHSENQDHGANHTEMRRKQAQLMLKKKLINIVDIENGEHCNLRCLLSPNMVVLTLYGYRLFNFIEVAHVS
ncbi:Hypothetical predicted protein [Octopus vulgaris]|uniref:Uncharacterized protein n=1 Tax=Octopus vulgaris TaxID=6645 RepID=A0AA36AST4_OCTVU|nr:Hypothetical predicted protein [Octopus vulgaris]